jgi:para-nitrobenzyl esterase
MDQQTIKTRQGWVQGSQSDGVRVWRGIPYAAAPVGEWRFRAPQPPVEWAGVRLAQEPGPIAVQPVVKDTSRMSGQVSEDERSEDCLCLNIWAPLDPNGEGQSPNTGGGTIPSKPDRLRPVLVWVHGGTFVSGAGSMDLYDGTAFVRAGEVIVVTLNYRLGPFGFLHLSPYGGGLGSNLGLLDQIAALEWVRDNIVAFGGDPGRVTIFGESAGAMSIAALLGMPAAKGLFQRAILQSGASQYLPAEAAAQVAEGFLAELQATRNEAEAGTVDAGKEQAQGRVAGQTDVAAWLASFSTDELQATAERLSAKLNRDGLRPMVFQPVLDGVTLPLDPVEAVRAGSAAGVELLIGTNRDEGAYFIRKGAPVLKREETVSLLGQFGFGPQAVELANCYEESNDGQAELVTDLIFWGPAVRLAEAQLAHGRVWMYRFDWSYPGHPLIGKSVHALEILFVFGNLFYLDRLGGRVGAEEEALSQRMQAAWIRFASEETDLTTWQAYDRQRRTTQVFDRTDGLESDPQADKRPLLV